MTLSDFFSSQLFGIILGALLTGGFTGFLEWLQSKRSRGIYIKQKREELYMAVCQVLMEHEKYRRSHEWPKKCKTMFNELQGKMLIYSSKKIYDEYYKLDEEICNCYDTICSQRKIAAKSNEIADKIVKLATKMRKELGIKDKLQ